MQLRGCGGNGTGSNDRRPRDRSAERRRAVVRTIACISNDPAFRDVRRADRPDRRLHRETTYDMG
jgi:hypothetical protein